MPATEQTWYNQKLLHVIFGVSSLVLLGATVWMLVKDHYRPWKVTNKKYAAVETQYGQYKILEAETAHFQVGLEQRQRELDQALRQLPDADQIKEFISTAEAMFKAEQIERFDAATINNAYAAMKRLQDAAAETEESDPQHLEAMKSLAQARVDLMAMLQEVVDLAKFNEDNLAKRKKNLSSERDAASSDHGLAIRDDLPAEVVAQRLELTEEKEVAVNRVEVAIEEIKAAREDLVAIITKLNTEVAKATKNLGGYRATIDRLHSANVERSGEGWTSYLRFIADLPIIDIGGKMKPKQIWLPDLTINYNLRDVARFDRCVTCHLAATTTEPGSATTPAFPQEYSFTVEFTPQKPVDKSSETLIGVYELRLAERGLLDDGDVTIIVPPQTLAAKAGLKTADVLTKIDGKTVLNNAQAENLLMNVTWGEPVVLEVRRGLPHPFSAHPRLDLYGTDSSPHPFGKIGCTVCHDGQGPATTFQHAEHTPSTSADEARWRGEHDWYANHFWEFPQRAKRFLESNCLKCHHSVTELEPSDRYPDAPAPKLMKGYHLIREYGCFGCHDINGHGGQGETVGPDLRFEPDYFAWAIKLKEAIAPMLAERRDGVAAALDQEQALVAKRDALVAERNAATKAGQQEQVAQIDKQIVSTEEQIKAAVITRQAVELPFDKLQEILSLAEQVRSVPEDSRARSALRQLLIADANGASSAAIELAQELQPLVNTLRAAQDQATQATSNQGNLKRDEDRLARLDEILTLAKQCASGQKRIDQTAIDRLRTIFAEDAAREGDARLLAEEIHRLGLRLVPLLSPKEHAIAAHLEDVTTPGTLRKVGPSLRYVGHKLDRAFLVDWLKDPTHFRPDTRMPKVFGNFAHLKTKEGGETEGSRLARRLESVEIRGLTEYLLSASAPFEYLDSPANVVPVKSDEEKATQISRGRDLVVTRGCLACHSVRDEGSTVSDDEETSTAVAVLGKADQDQGPDLSRMGAKLASRGEPGDRDSYKWLTSWLRQPSRYHARTKMPDLFLEPIPVKQPAAEAGQPVQFTDPAADIAAYLLSLEGATPWHPVTVEENDEALDELAMMHLEKAFRKSLALQYAKTGIPESKRASLKGDEVELIVTADDQWDTLDPAARDELIKRKKLRYVGRRSVSKYGCFGCHDIPGFEDAKPIGTGLADWGRKGTDRLAFEQIARYHGIEHGGSGHGDASHGEVDAESKQREEYFHHRLLHGDRDGFLWQKLREPRSYDYKKSETKGFNEWLLMPKFNFNDDEIEAVMTFVLGLVAEPPAPKYLYQPDRRRRAIVEGEAVLAKYNCQGCHVISPKRIDLAIKPGTFAKPDEFNSYEFLRPQVTPQQLRDSLAQDRRGLLSARLHVLDAFADDSPAPYLLTDSGDPYEEDPDFPYYGPFFRPFVLWRNAVVDGRLHLVGQKPLVLSESDIVREIPAHGGVATRLMMPLVYEQIKPNRANLTGNKTWAFVAPPLMDEGRKVQTDWLHDFLLDPYPIRPAVQLRMPKFNMSPDEASKLVAYFAAVDDVDYPYTFDPHTRKSYLDEMESRHSNRLGDAMKVVVGVCAECHKIGDFSPQGDTTAMAPNLSRIHQRLRPEFLREWIANPKAILPYTEMLVNFSHESLKWQEYYQGTSVEQLDAVVDLLLNYDQHTKNQVSVSELVKKARSTANPEDEGSTGAKTDD